MSGITATIEWSQDEPMLVLRGDETALRMLTRLLPSAGVVSSESVGGDQPMRLVAVRYGPSRLREQLDAARALLGEWLDEYDANGFGTPFAVPVQSTRELLGRDEPAEPDPPPTGYGECPSRTDPAVHGARFACELREGHVGQHVALQGSDDEYRWGRFA